MTRERFRRRTILAGFGAGALAATAGLSRFARPGSPPYTKYTLASTQTNTEALRVAWYETYNGGILDTQGPDATANVSDTLDPGTEPLYVDDAPGPVIEIGNVLPGDAGTLHVGLEAVAEDPVTVTMTGSLDANDENDITEPERAAGDVTSVGELATTIETSIWADTGANVLGGVGACDGTRGIGEREIASGTLGGVLDGLEDGIELVSCLGQEARTYCLGFEWSFPEPTTNVAQTDGVAFTLSFVPTLCEGQ
jgi:hypothetical protein